MAGGQAFVGVERRHGVWRFEFGRDGIEARGRSLPLPTKIGELPANAGLEALAVAPAGHPLAGALVAVAERSSPGAAMPTAGWVLTGPRPFAFQVARSGGFDVTDMAFLPDGDLLVLERHFTPLSGASSRIRRIGREAIRPGALLDGAVILAAPSGCAMDNLEAIAIHAAPGTSEVVVTIISDDNFNPFQRTLMMEFALAPRPNR